MSWCVGEVRGGVTEEEEEEEKTMRTRDASLPKKTVMWGTKQAKCSTEGLELSTQEGCHKLFANIHQPDCFLLTVFVFWPN